MQWRDIDQKQLFNVSIADRVAVVGYQAGSVTVRLIDEENDQRYVSFLDDCNGEAERSPVTGILAKDHKVWARVREQWYRGKVDTVTGQKVTVLLIDLAMTQEVARDNLRQLQSKELFFRPAYTRAFRLKGLRQNDIFSAASVRNRVEQAIAKRDKFTVTDTTNNYIDLQIDGTPKSLNHSLLLLFERQTGLDEVEEVTPPTPKPTPAAELRRTTTTTSLEGGNVVKIAPKFTLENISYPPYAKEMTKPPLYVFDCVYDGMNWIINAFHMKHVAELRMLSATTKSEGKALFAATGPPASFDDFELNQLCLIQNKDDQFDRCAYRLDNAFESIDVGVRYQDVAVERIRLLPRVLISQSYLMVLLLDDDHVEDMAEMTKRLEGLKNSPVNSVDQVVHLDNNNFKCTWKRV